MCLIFSPVILSLHKNIRELKETLWSYLDLKGETVSSYQKYSLIRLVRKKIVFLFFGPCSKCIFNCKSSSSTIYYVFCVSVCLTQKLKFIFSKVHQPIGAQFETISCVRWNQLFNLDPVSVLFCLCPLLFIWDDYYVLCWVQFSHFLLFIAWAGIHMIFKIWILLSITN